MELTLKTRLLNDSLHGLESCIDRKTTIPVLSHVLIKETDGKVSLCATNLDMGAIRVIDSVSVDKGFAACVPLDRFKAYCSMLNGDEVKLTLLENDYVQIQAKRSKTKMASLGVEQFPELNVNGEEWLTVDGDAFVWAINHTQVAISKEASRFTLNGMLIEADVDKVNIVATDGHRMACASISAKVADNVAVGNGSIILSKTAVPLISKMLNGGETVVSASVNHLYIKNGDTTMFARRLTGNFPDYKRAIKRGEYKAECSIGVEEFSGLLGRASVAIKDKSDKTCGVSLKFTETEVIASSRSENIDSVESEECKSFTGQPIEVGFNVKYLQEYLGTIEDEDTITIKIIDSHTPAMIAYKEGSFCIIAPMRL